MRRSTAGGAARGFARGWGAAGILVLPTLLLGSCMVQVDTFAVGAPNIVEARAEFYAVVDSTEELVGGVWDNQDSASSRGCAIAFGLAGRTYTALRLATPAPDASATLRTVVASWTQLGYTIERTRVGPATQLLATSEANQQLIFRISDRAMTLQGESECRPAAAGE